jgi:hypothetical protein
MISDDFEVELNNSLTVGSNHAGSYSIEVKLNRELPKLAQSMVKRGNFHYRVIQKLYPKCFVPHQKKVCPSSKKVYLDYVVNFIQSNPEVSKECPGRWVKILEKGKHKTPKKASGFKPPSRRVQPQHLQHSHWSQQDPLVPQEHHVNQTFR